MSVEIFIYRPEDAPRRSVPELRDALAALGVPCLIEDYEDGPWLTLEGFQSDMSMTIDNDGTASSVMLQIADDFEVIQRVCRAFEQLSWKVAEEAV